MTVLKNAPLITVHFFTTFFEMVVTKACCSPRVPLAIFDAWGEGDAERVYCCWRLFLPHFVAYHHTKYALQALRLQFQVKGYLSQHLAHHVLWDRFINSKGGMHGQEHSMRLTQ